MDINTHVSMIGGKWNIPYEKMNTFFIKYTQNINNMHMVERARYPCKMFYDIDKEYNPKELCEIYPDKDMVVCVNEESNGTHIIFQNWIVESPEEAINNCMQGIDTSVYRSGLRMIGSKKRNKNKRYFPKFRITNGKISDISPIINVESLQLCSILIPFKSVRFPQTALTKKITNPLKNNTQDIFNFSEIDENYKFTQITNVKKLISEIK